MPGFLDCWRCSQKCSKVVECGRCQVAKYCSKRCQQGDQWRHKSDCDAAIKVCRACGKKAENLKNCSACCQAYYCGVECQTKDRPKHKGNCKAVERKIKSLSKKISVFFAVSSIRVTTRLYYWGNYPAYDYLNLEENEGLDYETPLSVLVLGAGDLRNVVLTCASLPKNPKTELKFTLNEIEPCTLARLILLLYMLIQGEPDQVNQVTEIWYSTQLNDKTYQSLCLFLRQLSEIRSSEQLKLTTNGLLSINDEHLNEMKRVWKTWLELPVVRSKWISEQRKEAFDRDSGSKHGTFNYYLSIPSEHVKSAKKWMEDGVFVETRDSLAAENPTLTGCLKCVAGMQYSAFCFDPSVLPFSGWDYLEVKKFKHCNSMVKMYTAYVNDILRRSKETLSNGRVSFKAVLANCVDISQHLGPEEKFDRILTTNLSDYIPLPHLLELCSKQLNYSNPEATIVTETQNWIQDFYPGAAVEAVHLVPTPEMRNRVIKDTGSSSLLKDRGFMTYVDYHDNSKQFIEYLRATFYAIPNDLTTSQTQSTRLPSLKELGNKFQLQLRDFLRNENRIAYFKLALNVRRPSTVAGHERVLEWIPMK